MEQPIVVVGSSNVDLVMKMSRLPQRGESVSDAIFFQTFGGKGANQAVAAAKAAGADTTARQVHFVSCVGDDSFSSPVIHNLQQAGINTQFVFVESGVASGTALIMVDQGGENYLGVAPGANYRLGRAHVERAKDLICSAAMLVLQYEITTDTLQYVIDMAYRASRPILLNLAPPRTFPDETLRKLDILVVNETEASFLCGLPVRDEAQAWQAASALLAKGPRLVVLTLGANGLIAISAQERYHVPAFLVEAVDTTAAGDVFCGALAVALVEEQSLRQGLRFASAASAISVTRMGAQPSIPNRAEIEAFLRQAAERE